MQEGNIAKSADHRARRQHADSSHVYRIGIGLVGRTILDWVAPLDIQAMRYYILGYVMEEYGIGNHGQGTGHHPEIHP